MIINYTTGFAGTGKSHKLIEHLNTLDPTKTIVLAPTHKALRVLTQRLGSEDYILSTIHSMLGWIPGVNEAATSVHHVDITTKLEKGFEDGITNVIVDEFSMMSEDMLYDLTNKIEEATDYDSDHITLTLYGDPYQLPPVKATPIQTDPSTTTHLTTQYRAASKDIPALFEKFVHYIEGTNTKDLSLPASENVHLVSMSALKDFKRGDRALAYTNAMVGYLNKEIAQMHGLTAYKGTEVQLGNLPETTLVENYIYPTVEQLISFYEDGTLMLQNGQINNKFLEHSMQMLVSDPDIKFIRGTDDSVYPVLEGIGDAYLLRNKVKAQAAEAAMGTKARSKAWSRYYAIGRAYTMDHTFASTVHKAQGSEFNTVWIHKADMLKAIGPTRNYAQYARMMYVSLSRAIHRVNIIV